MYVVLESSAHMPSKVRARYARIVVVQLSQEFTSHDYRPKMISARARGVLRIVREYPVVPRNGKTERSGYVRTRRAATELAANLNNAADLATAEQIIGAGGSA